jgi:hypothetical protein
MAQQLPTRSGPSTSLTASAEGPIDDSPSQRRDEQIPSLSKRLALEEPATLDTCGQFTADEVPRRSEQAAPSTNLTELPTIGASSHSIAGQVPTITEQPVLSPSPRPAIHTSSQFAAEHTASAEPTTGETSGQVTNETYLLSNVGSRSSEAGSVISADDFSDEGYAASNTTGYISSIASDIRRGIVENERAYPNYGKNMYGMPMDEQELDRNDFQHHKWLLLLEGKLFFGANI